MPRIDSCSVCGTSVHRGKTSAQDITCLKCRAVKRCGTTAGYAAGCRCRPCKDAKAASMREYAARRRAQGRPLPRSTWRAYEDLQCDCCGVTFNREKRNDSRYTKAYCSLLCRDYAKYGPRFKKLPKDHMARWIGQTCKVKAPYPEGPFEYQCGWCGKQDIADYPTKEYCNAKCKKRNKAMRRRGRQFGAHGTFTWSQVVGLWSLFGKACAYCRQPVELEHMQAEHVIALARGGANNIGNILPSCGPCNSDKRDLSMEQWHADRERRNLPPVITRWSSDDPRYKHLAGDAMGLAA